MTLDTDLMFSRSSSRGKTSDGTVEIKVNVSCGVIPLRIFEQIQMSTQLDDGTYV